MTEAVRETQTHSKRRKWVEALLLIAGSTLVMFVLTSIALLIYTSGSPEPAVHVIDIPPGSRDLIEAGENPLEIPPFWPFYADDTLVLDNRDDVVHTLGDRSVPPNTVGSVELQPPDGGLVSTSLHPSGEIKLDIQLRDYDFSLIALPVFFFGIAVGGLLWIGLTVMRALDHTPDMSEYLGRDT